MNINSRAFAGARFASGCGAFLLGVLSVFSAAAGPGTVSVGSASVTVTNGAATTMSFPLTRSGDSEDNATVFYSTVDGSAAAGTDYTASSGSVTIPAGSTSATVQIPLTGESAPQPTKQFYLQLLSAAGSGPAVSFAAPFSPATGNNPAASAMGDLNGDGKLDLVVPNYNDNTVSVLLNTSPSGATTPSFAAQTTFATGSAPSAVALADVNGDGKLDIVVANTNDSTVSVLLNTTTTGAATPSFAAQKTFATAAGDFPGFVAVADLNGDGKPDIVVSNSAIGTVSVLLNTTAPGAATASFAAQKAFATGDGPVSVVISDINGDGKPDLIVASEDSSTVSVLLNTTAPGAAAPSFAALQGFAAGNAPTFAVVGDVNGDGKPDIAVVSYGDSTVSVLLNTTAPGAATVSFAAQQTFNIGGPSFYLALGDVNGDGKPDLVASTAYGNTVSVLLNTTVPGAAMSNFAAQQTFSTGSSPGSVTIGDVNGDGKPDIVVVNSGSNTVSVLLNNTSLSTVTPGFAAQQTFSVGANPTFVAARDLNGDGKPDLVVANYGASGKGSNLSVLLNSTAPGAVSSSFAAQQSFSTGTGPIALALGDFNEDGKPDIVVADFNYTSLSMLINTTAPGAATASFGGQPYYGAGTGPSSVAVADFNGDGLPDIAEVNQFDGTLEIYLNSNSTVPGGNPSFDKGQTFTVGGEPVSVATGDFNGDGKPDVVVANQNSLTISVLLNTTAPGATTASFTAQQTFGTGNGSSVAVADFNGDGKPDIVVANIDESSLSMLLNTTPLGAATPSFATGQTFSAGFAPSSVAVADVNGDGKPDLVVASEDDNTVLVFLNTTAPGASTFSFTAVPAFAAGNGPTSVALADVNGDGKPDIVAANSADNTVSVLLNTQYQVTASSTPGTGTISYTGVAPLAAPTNVTAVAGNARVQVSWTAVAGATQYVIYDGTTSGGESGAPAGITTSTTAAVTSLSNGTKYYFTVKAYNSTSGYSPASSEVSATPAAVPAAPTGVAATAGSAQVSLSWTAVSGATSYNVYEGTSSGGESATAAASGITGTSSVITGLSNGTKYYFTVKAVNSNGAGAASAEVSATPVLTLAAPTGVSAVAGNARVQVSWTAVSGATQYVIYDGTTSGGESGAPAGITTATTAAVTSLTNGTKYYFKVKAYNTTSGYSAASSEVSATPVVGLAAPTGVGAVAGNARVQVSWTAVAGATEYVIYDATSSGAETGTPAGITTATTAAITSLTNGTKYYFTVKAYNSTSGYSSASTEVSATPAVGLAAPTGVGAVAGNARVQVSWTAVAGATEYVIYDATSSGAETGTPAGITTATTAAVTSLTNGTKYYFTVKAYNSTSGYSSASSEVSATPEP